ncbi:MAG TPA: Crp/Fnr family transcriptional regulator [Jiangellaceae bacterium]
MDGGVNPVGAVGQALRRLGGDSTDARLRQAAWVARCVGRGDGAPLRPEDVTALAGVLEQRDASRGTAVFTAGEQRSGVWIVREGRVELSLGSGRRRAVIHVLRPGDVDGDIELLLGMPMPYTARALTDASVLHLSAPGFESLVQTNPAIARRWLSSVARRLAASQERILGLLGKSLTEQVARLLLDEAVENRVELTQRTIAAMLGVQRPSLNKVLKQLEANGLISISYGTIELTDRAGLAKRG